MNLSMFFHEFLAILVVCTLGGWAPLFERSWVQFLVSLAKYWEFAKIELILRGIPTQSTDEQRGDTSKNTIVVTWSI